MPTPALDAVETTAIEACKAGGTYLRDAYRSGNTTADAGEHDVKSSADTAAEERILAVIRDRFPDHPLEAEESGIHEGSGRYRWLVDPLDGTNNFEAGLPSFATGITVLDLKDDNDPEPVLGVVYAPVSDDLYVGRRGRGVRHDGQPVTADSDLEPAAATIVSVIGHDVKRDPEHAAVSAAINRSIEDRCKRRLESWSPTVHWGLLARGRLDGIVCYRPDREEQLLGELFSAESGLRTAAGDEWFVAAGNDAVFDAVREIALEHA
ncbi:inositol monophosphatase family protein [Natronobacterium texcoconense]|uniref:fructose-bisphosphatase n=1 Tax=Natronobacterium texcoconense TaxID=1095778 RepID=A0A1H1J225_NATTX|nr:inositol monophosphatase family protein [Natronobacterium texcoconense]SDR44047.1 myo-inositol-1(or 4)-monophosphatase [Natronobacterium texcoconense]